MDSTGRITRENIEKIRGDVPRGLDEFVRHYGPRLLVFVRYKLGRRLGSKVEPDDVLQDFFATLVENSDSFLDKVDARGVHRTVFRMLENRIKDLYEFYYKTGKRDGNREVREGPSGDSKRFSFTQVAGPTASISQRIEALDEYRSMDELVNLLEGEARRLFILKFVEELTNQEIADELGVSISTVKRLSAQLVRTIQKVRRRA